MPCLRAYTEAQSRINTTQRSMKKEQKVALGCHGNHTNLVDQLDDDQL